ncbi:MAG: sulfurtransferase [Pseudomonadota bacterium]
MTHMDTSPLVSAAWLRANIDAPDIRLVDATWYLDAATRETSARAAFEAEHIPGAVFFDIDEIRDHTTDLPHMMPSTTAISSKVRKMGLGDGNRLVIYDRNNFMASARVWWMFRVLGQEEVFVLDGGLDAWTDVGGSVTDELTIPVERHFTPRVRGDLIRDLDQMAAAITNPAKTILDARPTGRFTGEAPEPRAGLPSGHMPGARNIPAGSLIEEDGRMKSPEALARIFDGISGRVITTCGSGVTAATLALALATVGHDDAAVFDGSWAEWASTEGYPIETGAGAHGGG